jgi:hypothetical protein
MVSVPKLPGATTALATPPTSNPPPAPTATTTVPNASRVNNIFLPTI